ncbi:MULTISPECIES: Xaa-Pro peptidase family protein [Asticcacaulis]|uniref:M24 family metallopeptidase n=1 Tax=Asticcacaulis TaxID=76890 RepID=UPI001AE2684C|nr:MULTISPECIES: Xaa-Pro peptidase family protein [Asticcacaulis]MBP2160985.1 Xaa-Pro dipeptidase [Asticcacaulis solisilvae]MDR6802030.1 Xaa-Pro dipeptidase [Asticcacaulis sp. BE141]
MIGSSTIQHELAALTPPEPAPLITRDERLARLDKARRLTSEMGAGALLVGAGASLRYFVGLPWGASERLIGLLLPVDGDPILICPYFERGSVEADTQIAMDYRLWHEHESPHALIRQALGDWGVTKLAVDPAMAFEMVSRLGKETGAEIFEASSVINGCRMYKSPTELAAMQQAKSMTLQVHHATSRILHEGITAAEVTQFIEAAHRKLGAAGNSFCIVQFGRGTAFPHGLPGVQTLRENDLVLIDTGCYVQGYSSDITRTYAFGKVDEEHRRIWDIEKEAQAAAFAAVKVGAPCETADYAARKILAKYKLGPDYDLPGTPHRTGHGIGLNIHEPAYLVRGDKTPFAPGMCFSNEPMIVVPDRFGIRLEDHMYVTENGAKWFTEPQAAIDRL